MQKIRYEIDPHNRLVINKGWGLNKYRLSLDGYFKTDKDNTLQYNINAPYRYSRYDKLPYRINLKGNYSITKNHDLLLTLSRSFKQRLNETLLLKGDIVYVKENSIGFAVATKNMDGTTMTRTLILDGRWKMDDNNRLNFIVEKERGRHDTLTFTASWVVNDNNEIEYSYKKTLLKRKERREQKIIFKGFWEIIDNNRINYALGLKGDSGFEIEASLVRAGFLGKRNALIYKLGTRVYGKEFKPKLIAIFGSWKLTKRTGLLFEVRYSEGRKDYLSFGAEVSLSERDELGFELIDNNDIPLGVGITLKRRFLKDSGEALIKLLASKKEKSIRISAGKLF